MPQDDASLLGRGVAFPPRIGLECRFAYSDGTDNVRESIRVILSTDRQERIMLPQFGGGLVSYLFAPNTPDTHRLIQERITQSLGRWEPRIDVQNVRVAADPNDARAAIATVRYKLRATGLVDSTSLSVRLAG